MHSYLGTYSLFRLGAASTPMYIFLNPHNLDSIFISRGNKTFAFLSLAAYGILIIARKDTVAIFVSFCYFFVSPLNYNFSFLLTS